MRLRIMSYNLRRGGGLPGGPDCTDDILAVIAAEAPDVLALQECRGFMPGERDMLATYERRLGMRGAIARGASGLHVALLARPELDLRLLAARAEPFRHGAIAASIRPDGRTLTVLAAHLNPFLEDLRVAEVMALLELVPPGPAILAADLNALSPRDAFPPERLRGLRPQYRVTPPSKSLSDAGPESADCRAVGRLLDAGFVDLAHELPGADRGDTFPTPLDAAPPMRIDYIMTTGDLRDRARSYRAVRTELAARASDHWPLVCDLDL